MTTTQEASMAVSDAELAEELEKGISPLFSPHGHWARVLTQAATRLREIGAGRVVATMHEGENDTLFSKGWNPSLAGYNSVPLSTLTQPQADEVTEAMVWTFIEVSRDESAGYTCWTDAVRAALLAALQAKSQPEGGE